MSALLFDRRPRPSPPFGIRSRSTQPTEVRKGFKRSRRRFTTGGRTCSPLSTCECRPASMGSRRSRASGGLIPIFKSLFVQHIPTMTGESAFAELGHTDSLLFLKKPFDEVEVLQGAHAMARKWWLQRAVKQRLHDLEDAVRVRTLELQERNASLQEEITERSRAEEQFRYLATHDLLTRLANRVLLYDRLKHAIEQAARHKHPVGVALIDLDDFKPVNDGLGHRVGDLLLQAVAGRLTDLMRRSDTIARMGGDEFVVVMERLVEPDEAEMIAGRLSESLQSAFDIEGHHIKIAGSIGLSVYPEDAEDAESLLKGADTAMYSAKEKGRGRWERCTNVWGTSKSTLRDELSEALETRSLHLAFQPVVGFESGEIKMSMEVLVRWNHPEFGDLSPSYFVRAAEVAGLAAPFGDWVLDAACSTMRDWLSDGIAPRAMAINVSGGQLRRAEFADSVKATLDRYGLKAEQLELEVTESAAMEDVDRSVDTLGRLRTLGVRIVIDDFGAGFSSIRRLKQFSVCAIKIDRFWTEHIATNRDDAATVGAIIAMARSLGLEVVAEGIETSEQIAALQEIASLRSPPIVCDRLQGYLLGRPLKNETARQLLRDTRRKPGLNELLSLTADLPI